MLYLYLISKEYNPDNVVYGAILFYWVTTQLYWVGRKEIANGICEWRK